MPARRWTELTRNLDNGRLEISNNTAENQIRPLKLGAKNWLFAGSDAGGRRATAFYTLIKTAKLNGLEPEAHLRDVIAQPPESTGWNWRQPATQSVAAGSCLRAK